MKHFRRARGNFLAQYVGWWYAKVKGATDSDAHKAHPVNLVFQGITTLVPNLVYHDPRVRVRTNILAYRHYADLLELATNHLIRELKFRETLRKTITDALFGLGVIKTGIAVSGQTLALDDQTVDIGQPYADRVDFDDLVLDPVARDWAEQEFIGNRVRLPRQFLLDSGMFNPEQVQKLTSRYDSAAHKSEAAGLADAGKAAEQYREVCEYVDLVEVWLPRHQLIVTIPYSNDQGPAEFLRVVEYEGPETGPYHPLGFAYVPDQVLPVAPVGIWYDLHVMVNRTARKVARQADRIKRVLAYEPSATEDAQAIAEAEDGECVKVDNIDAIREVEYGGASEQAYEFLEWAQRKFSEVSGNLDLLAGVDTNSPTATQAEMLQANSSVRVADMQQIVYRFTEEVVRDLAFYVHTDPLIELPLVKRVNGQDLQVVYTPEMREGDWLDYTISIQPYSMARQDPNLKVRRIMEFAASVIPAAAQAFQLLGPAFNIQGFLALVAREVGIEEADEIVNNAVLQQWIMTQMMLIPPDGKAAGSQMGQMPGMMGMAAAAPGGIRPQQPNPMARMAGGITPQTEQAMAQQEVANELQSSMLEPSARSRALMMS